MKNLSDIVHEMGNELKENMKNLGNVVHEMGDELKENMKNLGDVVHEMGGELEENIRSLNIMVGTGDYSMIEHLLTEGENVELAFDGNENGFWAATQHMFITNKRVIRKTQYTFSSDTTDMLYGDISNVKLHKGIFTSEIYLRPRILSDDTCVSRIGNVTAEKAVTLIRNHVNDFEKHNKKQEQQQIVIQGDSSSRNKRVCPKCGMQNERDAKFCSDCGFGLGVKKEE